MDLANLQGRVVYLDFWASWCTPCRHSFPWMNAMKAAYERLGLTVIAVNVDADRGEAERFLAHFHHEFDVPFDPRGTLAEHYKVEGMPTSVLIDRHGVIRFRHIGFKPEDAKQYETQLRQLLDEH